VWITEPDVVGVGEPSGRQGGVSAMNAGPASRDSLATAAWKALILLALSFVGFMLIPDRLLSYLSVHVAPRTRDSFVSLWLAVFFVFMTWLFVRLQVTSRRRA
jgi:hypothetical protein